MYSRIRELSHTRKSFISLKTKENIQENGVSMSLRQLNDVKPMRLISSCLSTAHVLEKETKSKCGQNHSVFHYSVALIMYRANFAQANKINYIFFYRFSVDTVFE